MMQVIKLYIIRRAAEGNCLGANLITQAIEEN